MNPDGLMYVINQLGIALATANQRIEELTQQLSTALEVAGRAAEPTPSA